MIPKLAAWVLVSAAVYGAYVGVSSWKNPLSMPNALPITTVLPPAYEGCGKACL